MKARRVWWAVGIAAAAFGAAEAGIYCFRSTVSAREQRVAGRMLADHALVASHWKELEVNDRFRDMIQGLNESLTSQAHSVRLISLDPSRKDEQPKDDFERDLFVRFAGAPGKDETGVNPLLFAERHNADRSEYRYYRPVFAGKSCFFFCHSPSALERSSDAEPPFGRAAPGNQKWKEGDLMAVVEVAIPLPLNEH